MRKLEEVENTKVDLLARVCLKMGCQIEDIMKALPDQESVHSSHDEQNA